MEPDVQEATSSAGEILRSAQNDTVNNLLPLDAPQRVVCFEAGGAKFTHIMRKIGAEDWNGYFSRLLIEEDSESSTFDLASALLWLWDQCVQRVEGYPGAPNWKERVRMSHRLAVCRVLIDVAREPAPEQIDVGLETVAVNCAWHDGNGMVRHSGLLHRFAFPTTEHMVKYSRETSRSLVVRGSMKGRTRFATKHKVLVSLYDELIQSVEGYSVNGHALEGPDNIKQHMDAFHKFRAVEPLFSAALEAESSPA